MVRKIKVKMKTEDEMYVVWDVTVERISKKEYFAEARGTIFRIYIKKVNKEWLVSIPSHYMSFITPDLNNQEWNRHELLHLGKNEIDMYSLTVALIGIAQLANDKNNK